MGHQPLRATHVAKDLTYFLKKKKKCDLKCKDNPIGEVTISSSITAVEELREAKW